MPRDDELVRALQAIDWAASLTEPQGLDPEELERFNRWREDPKNALALSDWRLIAQAEAQVNERLNDEDAPGWYGVDLELDEEKGSRADGLLDRIESQGIALPPGYHLAVIARFILTPKAYRQYVEPVIADMQYEYIKAIAKENYWLASWITVRGHLLVIPGWVEALLVGTLKRWLGRCGL